MKWNIKASKIKSIFKLMKLKITFFIVAILAMQTVIAQNKKDTSLIGADTLNCHGNKIALIQNLSKNDDYVSYYDLKTLRLLLYINKKYEGEGEGRVYFYNFVFPELNINCDVIPSKKELIDKVVCKYGLINEWGLDTLKAETFVTIKGNYKKKLVDAAKSAVNFTMLERDRTKPITILGNDIYQDDKVIGSFEELKIQSPGGELKQFQVNNTMKQMVCLSTALKAGSHDWRTLTNFDNKYHILKSTDGNDLMDLVKFMVESNYL